MIHFDFIVEEGDAENIFDCIQQQINYNNLQIQHLVLSKKDEPMIDDYKRYVEYLTSLKEYLQNQLKELDKYFTSANNIPVERATIMAKDYWKIRGIEDLNNEICLS